MSKQSGGGRSGRIDLGRIEAATQDDIDKEAEEELSNLGMSSDIGPPYTVFSYNVPDVRRLRDSLKYTQSEFAEQFGLSLRTVQQWEQGRSNPDQPARILLTTIEVDPDAVARAASVAIWRTRVHKHSENSPHLSLRSVLTLTNGVNEADIDAATSIVANMRRLSSSVQSGPNESKRFVA
jgi:putative transcriptional regulator